MINPCRSCGLGMSDKNNADCLNCDRRVNYVAALEGRSFSMPVEMTDMDVQRDPDKKKSDDRFMLENPGMAPAQIAAELGRSVTAIYARRNKLGLTKDKRRELIKARDEMRKNIKTDRPVLTDLEYPVRAIPAELTASASLLVVNAQGFEDLYERLKRSAKENFRTPELQALWFIHQALQAEDGAGDQRRAPDRSS